MKRCSIKPVVFRRGSDSPLPSVNRHSFTLERNGYRLVFDERDDFPPPYWNRFSLVSFDKNMYSAYLGIGKRGKHDCISFADAVEKEMEALQEERNSIMLQIRELKRKLRAIDAFFNELPKIMLEDGVDFKKNMK